MTLQAGFYEGWPLRVLPKAPSLLIPGPPLIHSACGYKAKGICTSNTPV